MSRTLNKWNETFFELSDGTKFSVCHNLPMEGNINSIHAAFDNWIARTEYHSAESFIEYINSKGIYIAMSKKKWNELNV